MGNNLTRYRLPIFAVALLALIWLCYGQTLAHDFFWDTKHIFNTGEVQSFGFENLQWILTNTVLANWHPLSLLTHMVDFQLYGSNPAGHHFTNILIHVLCCLLVFLTTRQLVSIRVANRDEVFFLAVVTTCLFALHPLRVESVAWVAARKDLLYSVFFLLAVMLYVAYCRSSGQRRAGFYCLSLFCFACSLLSKSMAVTLPAVLVLLDLYPLSRLNVRRLGIYLRSGLIDKLPFIALSMLVILVTLSTQSDAMGNQLSTLDQLRNATHNVVFYLERVFVPIGLVPFYPFPGEDKFFSLFYWLPQLALIAGLTIVAFVSLWRGHPLFAVCWFLYLVMLSPASGVIHVGSAVAADRYTYLSQLPILMLLAIGAVRFYLEFDKLKRVVLVVAVLGAVTLTSLTYMQVTHWRDSVTLWSHVLQHYPDASLARRNLSTSYFENGDYENALFHIDVLAVQGWPVAPLLVEALDATGRRHQGMVRFSFLLEQPNISERQRSTYREVIRLLENDKKPGP